MDTYTASVSTKFDAHGTWTLLPVIGPVISFLEPSKLPGEYAAHCCQMCSATSLTLTPQALLLNNNNPSKSYQLSLLSREFGLIKHNYHLYPQRSPFILEAITVKCLVQGQTHHRRGQDSNPHSDDSAIRMHQVRRTKPLGRGISFRVNTPGR